MPTTIPNGLRRKPRRSSGKLSDFQKAVIQVGAAVLAGPYGKVVLESDDGGEAMTVVALRARQLVEIVAAMEDLK